MLKLRVYWYVITVCDFFNQVFVAINIIIIIGGKKSVTILLFECHINNL